MKPFASRVAPLLLLAACAVGTGSAQAQSLGGLLGRGAPPAPPQDRGGDRRHDRGDDHRALSDAVRRVERQSGGQVLSAERVPFDGRDVNRVKVVDSNGRVRVYMDDPQGRREAPPRRIRGDDSDSD